MSNNSADYDFLAGVRVVETQEQPHDGRLSSSTRADDGQHLAGCDLKRHVMERLALAIGVVVMAALVITLKSRDKRLAEVDAVATV